MSYNPSQITPPRLTPALNTCWRRVSRWALRDDGSAMVETALGLMMIFTMILAITEFSLMAYTYSVYADASRQGVRYASMHGTDSGSCSGPSSGCADSTAANVVTAVTTAVTGYTSLATLVNVAVSYPDGTSTPSSRVSVTASYQYNPMFQLQGFNIQFSTTSSGRVIY